MSDTDPYLYAILAVMVLLVALSVWRYQCAANSFDLLDLLMENGRASRLAVAFAVSLAVTSWLMLKLSVDGKLTEGYLAIYGGLWVSPILTKMFATSTPSAKEP